MRAGDGAVADVGVDFDEEIAADDHRLELGMVDVGGDDGAAAGDFGADEFGGDFARDRRRRSDSPGCWWARESRGVTQASCLYVGVHLDAGCGAGACRRDAFSTCQAGRLTYGDARRPILADGDKFHLRRDDALARIPELRDGMVGCGAERFAFRALEMVEAVLALGLAGEFFVAAREVAVVFRFDLAAFVLGHVPSPADPFLAQGRECLCSSRRQTADRPTGRWCRRRGPAR